ncbi:uncharacterized protein TRIADDRAFT_52410 [Trichoplax adhaerens]|uniref:Uncharacterized protein n=1 Tax=Trichoplax adhaerens TaxID=10228 RepID=B3RIB0_TRIAD|nr:predicted protein [Trichoplax adhaerens]EDV28988.1 predicted protein [Trichoplax adhaerens]|eukprot:XP_002108190.1 predicted protein [Trichoplax adhaerens]
MHKELSVTPLHAKVPLVIAQRGMIFNMESVTHLEDNTPTSKSFTVLGRGIGNILYVMYVSDCEKIKSERGVSIYKFRNSEQMQNNEGSEIVGRKDVIPISYVAEYRSNLQSKIGYGSLKIPANGYSAEYDCNGNTDNHAWITVDIRTGEKLFTFFSFPISVRSEQSNIGVDYDTIALGNLGEYYPQFVDHESHSRINHSDYTLNCNQYDEIDVKGDGNDRNTANNINLQFEETTDNRIGDKGSTTTKEILGVNSCKESEIESVIRSVCGVNTNRDNRILSKASLKSSLLREISQTTISQDDDWKDLNLYGDSRTLYDCSTDHIPDFVSSHRLPKNFGESITIDEDTASSSENEDSTPGKRYPAQSIISRYVSEIRHNNVLASFQSNTRECAPVFSPDVNLSAVSIDSNSKWQILSSGDDGNCSTAQNLRQTGEVLDLLYDSQLNCYFDPKTYKYYELID